MFQIDVHASGGSQERLWNHAKGPLLAGSGLLTLLQIVSRYQLAIFFNSLAAPNFLAMSPSDVEMLPGLLSITFLVNGCARRRVSSAIPGSSAGNASPRRETASASPAGGDDTH